MKKIFFILTMAFATINADAQCVEAKAACNTTYQNLRYAVAKVDMPGVTGNFTGFLINHTSNDGRLLFVTTHLPFSSSCSFDPSDLATALNSTTFTWNQDFSSCSGSASTTVTSTGATLLAYSGFIALLELNNAPNLPQLTYLGWDMATVPTSQACIFQSSDNNVKKGIVTSSSQSVVSLNVNCNGTFTEASGFTDMIKISAWDAAEPVALGRGAPLIMNNKKVEGVYIVGNETDCDKGPSYFFDIAAAGSPFLSYLRSGSQTNAATISRPYCISNKTLTGNLNASFLYSVSNSIVSTQNIGNGYTVKYEAGTYIEMNNGFSSGTDFVAQIDPCDGTVTIIAAKTDETGEERKITNNTSEASNSLKIYPTVLSTGNAIYIETNEYAKNLTIAIYDLQGKVILTSFISELNPRNPHSIPISNLSSGLYLVKAWNDTITATQKIIIK